MRDRRLPPSSISHELMEELLRGCALPPMGMHGLPHWARVLETGLRLGHKTGASPRVVELFAVFHDCCRLSEGRDRGHGRRGAERARALRGRLFDLPEEEFQELLFACDQHTNGLTSASITVQTCWDADRLDLGRVGIRIRDAKLCTEAARAPKMIAWADRRARMRIVPPIVEREWHVRRS